MRHNMDIFDRTIRHYQAIFMFKILPILRRALDCLFHEGGVFRMNPLEDNFEGRFRRSILLEDSKGFLGPEELCRGRPPAEAASLAQTLRLRQVSLTLA